MDHTPSPDAPSRVARRAARLSTAAWAAFVCRVLVGLVFVVAGATKLAALGSFTATLLAYAVLPVWAIRPLALTLPWVEVAIGGYLLAGLFARPAAWAAVVLLAVFSAAIAQAVWRGLSLEDCGCFGALTASVPLLQPLLGGPSAGMQDVVRDAMYALLALAVALGPPTPFSLDTQLARRRSAP
jgi:uncharacterized membrane protein YphA (DoxX/SURF4 family)